VRLFDRTPRSVTLTGEDRRFHAQVIPLLAGIEEAATEAAGWSWARPLAGAWRTRPYLLTDWSDEVNPLYSNHPSRHLPLAKIRAFLDFVQETGSSQARNDG
jgi:hypothetical protein